MPRLLDYLSPIYNFLTEHISPDAPRALFVALVFASVLAWRKWSPNTWRAYSKLIPVSDEQTSRFTAALRKAWQALPSVVLSALYAGLGTGFDVWPTLQLALLGLLPPIIHELGWRYEGNLGDGKDLDKGKGDGEPRFLSASVHGAGSAWLSEDGKSAGGELRDEAPGSRSLRLQRLALVGLLVLPNCASWKPIVRTTDNIASDLCQVFFHEKNKISLEDAAKQFCSTKEDLQPWIESVLAAKREAGAVAVSRQKSPVE